MSDEGTPARDSANVSNPVDPESDGGAEREAITDEPSPQGGVEDGTALCLSGGGYRAMLFHLGALWRLNEAGYLPRLDRVSSVSGGSITAATLGLKWSALKFDDTGVSSNFDELVVAPLRKMASKTIDRGSILKGIMGPGTISDRVASAYRKYLFSKSTLEELPDVGEGPRFVINATNLGSGALWRFSKPYMADWKMGRVDNPTVELATAVAASSAFPPVLSPAVLEVDPASYAEDSKSWPEAHLQSGGKVYLSDGGVYDNLGLETVKRFKTVLVSDGGGAFEAIEEPKRDWTRQSIHVLKVVDNQVRSLRKRELLGDFTSGGRSGTFWGLRTNIADYGLTDSIAADFTATQSLAATPTRLRRMPKSLQERLINWGYAVSDAALRRWVDHQISPPRGLPYPRRSLG